MSVRERTIEILEERIQGESQILVSAEAIDVILQLLKEQQWISVEDELPEKSGRYLVFFGKSIVETMKTSYWLPEKQIWMGAEAYSSLYGITHWMPLPEPPEEVMPDEQ